MAYTIGDLVEHGVDLYPERTALIEGEREITYRELEERANRLAHHLLAAGVRPGDRVALYGRNTIESVVAMVAIFKARAVMVNVNYRYVPAELQHLLEDSDAAVLVHEDRYSDVVAATLPSTPGVRECVVIGAAGERAATPPDVPDGVLVTDYSDALAGASAERDFGPRSDDDLYMLYTGGTTGFPKGVLWRQEDVVMVLGGGIDYLSGEKVTDEWELARRSQDSDPLIRLALPPLIHGGAQWAILMALFAGHTSVVVPDFDPEEVWRVITGRRVNLVFITGDAMARPLIEAWDPERHDGSSLFFVGSSAALFSPSVKEQFLEAFPNAFVSDSIGASETGFAGIAKAERGSAQDGGPRVTLDAQSAVLDADGRRIEPGSGAVGKLARAGHIPLGYHKDEAKTAATFPVIDGVRWAVPGDDARVEDDGTVTMLGRGSVSINTGGEKVHPEQVEGALKAHPDVFDALVVGVPDERMGSRVAAVLTGRPGRRPSLDELNECARQAIARYKCPRSVWWVDEIRRSPAGKPDYRWAVSVTESRPADEEQEIRR